jgi:hypothetical protein
MRPYSGSLTASHSTQWHRGDAGGRTDCDDFETPPVLHGRTPNRRGEPSEGNGGIRINRLFGLDVPLPRTSTIRDVLPTGRRGSLHHPALPGPAVLPLRQGEAVAQNVVILAWLLTAVWFGAAHLPTYGWNFAQAFIVIGGARLVLSLAFIRTKNLSVSSGAHILNDWTLFTFALLGNLLRG